MQLAVPLPKRVQKRAQVFICLGFVASVFPLRLAVIFCIMIHVLQFNILTMRAIKCPADSFTNDELPADISNSIGTGITLIDKVSFYPW